MQEKTWKLAAIVLGVIVVLAIGTGAGVLIMNHHNKTNTTAGSSNNAHFTKLSITLRNGHLVNPADTYVVKPGVGLEFSIDSNVFGKVGVPTSPAQTITFTQSPLVFHFYAPTKAGNYPLSYQANGSSDVITIGTIVVN